MICDLLWGFPTVWGLICLLFVLKLGGFPRSFFCCSTFMVLRINFDTGFCCGGFPQFLRCLFYCIGWGFPHFMILQINFWYKICCGGFPQFLRCLFYCIGWGFPHCYGTANKFWYGICCGGFPQFDVWLVILFVF